MTSAAFRYPGPLAIAVAQVDEMSSGRVEFGLGGGRFENEHQAKRTPQLAAKCAATSPLVGTPAEIVDRLDAWKAIGVQRVYTRLLDLSDLAHLELVASEVMPQLL